MLQLEHISKTYHTTEIETAALDDVSLDVAPGEFLAVMGPSGCGKSTLLNILGLIDSPTTGTYRFLGEDISQCSEEELTLRRRGGVGFVFQNFNLIDDLTVIENIEVALLYLGSRAGDRRRRAQEALERVDLAHRARHLPKQLSGGQQQRVAVARALVSNPKLILADEPTGNLDSANGDAIMNLLSGVARSGTTIIMVTHSEEHAKRAHHVMHMLDGRFVTEVDA
jgi:putative ABC transport system ATP-binding protein